MWLIVIRVLVIGLNLMSASRNQHEYMMGLHRIHVNNWIGDMNNNGVHEVLAEELGWKAFLAQCLHTIQWLKESNVGE